MNHTVKQLGLVLVSGSFLLVASCASDASDVRSAPAQDIINDEAVASIDSALYSTTTDGRWVAGDVVPVCFTTPGMDSQKAQIREYVTNTWQSIANISFSWLSGLCPTTGSTLYVRVNLVGGESGSSYAYMGKKDALRPPTADVTDASSYLWAPPEDQAGPIMLQLAAVHEFGHTLGFAHEQDRIENMNPDPNCNYPDSKPGTSWSAYDEQSVMHYCGPGLGQLSSGDVVGAQAAFPFTVRSKPFSIPIVGVAPGDPSSVVFYEGSPNKTLRTSSVYDCCGNGHAGSEALPHSDVRSGAMEGPPSVYVEGTSYIVFWQGRDRRLWMTLGASGNQWTPSVVNEGPLSMPPIAVGSGGDFNVFYRSSLFPYLKRYSSVTGGWLPAVRLNSSILLYNLSAVALATGVVELFWQSAGNGKLWHSRSNDNGATWSSAVSLATMSAEPRAVGRSDGTADVFWRGTDGYLMRVHMNANGSTLAAERLNSGVMASDPAPIVTSPGKMEVFWRGSDGNLWRMGSNNNVWYAATNMNETMGSADPSAAGHPSGAIDVSWRWSLTGASAPVFLKRYRPSSGWLPKKDIRFVETF